jgi:hypothetical protein
MCASRLRLEAFASHHAAALDSICNGAKGDAVLVAFVAAVRQVLRMQASALQVLRRQSAAGNSGGGEAAVAAVPAMTLAELVVSLSDLSQQLKDLSRLCRCGPAAPKPAAARAQGGSAAVAGEAVAGGGQPALKAPWPTELAAWAAEWGWGPSAWQVQGFVSGLQLLDGLYGGEGLVIRDVFDACFHACFTCLHVPAPHHPLPTALLSKTPPK